MSVDSSITAPGFPPRRHRTTSPARTRIRSPTRTAPRPPPPVAAAAVGDPRRALQQCGCSRRALSSGGGFECVSAAQHQCDHCTGRYSPSASAPAIATSAIASAPTSPRATLRATAPRQRDQRRRTAAAHTTASVAGREDMENAPDSQGEEDGSPTRTRGSENPEGRSAGAQAAESGLAHRPRMPHVGGGRNRHHDCEGSGASGGRFHLHSARRGAIPMSMEPAPWRWTCGPSSI